MVRFDLDPDVFWSIVWVSGMKTFYILDFSLKLKSQSFFKNYENLRFYVFDSNHGNQTHFMIQIKLDKGKTIIFRPFDLNLFYTWLESISWCPTLLDFFESNFEYDSNHTFFKHFPVGYVRFDLNNFLYMIQIMWSLIQITFSSWFESTNKCSKF